MADYTTSKDGVGEIFDINKIEGVWLQHEPLITPEKVIRLHLWGIPLISAVKDPRTGKPMYIGPEELKEYIIEAVALAEIDGGFDIFPKQFKEKLAFDKPEYESLGFMQLRHRPIQSLQAVTITASNEQTIYSIPLDWIDVGYLHQGQLNLIPLTIALQTNNYAQIGTGPYGAQFMAIFGHRPWIASFFEVIYTTGFKDGMVPRVVNQLIGVITAMEVLAMLATTYSRSTSASLSIDGLSQSQSTPGPDLFNDRLKILQDKRKFLVKKLQRQMGLGMFTGSL